MTTNIDNQHAQSEVLSGELSLFPYTVHFVFLQIRLRVKRKISCPAFIQFPAQTAHPSGDQQQSTPSSGLLHVLVVVQEVGVVLQRGCQLPNWEFGTQCSPCTRHHRSGGSQRRRSRRRRKSKRREEEKGRVTAACLQQVKSGEEVVGEGWLDSDQLHAGLGSRRKSVCLQRDTRNRRRGREEPK